MQDVPNVIYKPSGGISWSYYLHIRGGAGYEYRKPRLGGQYDYILFYASPSEMKDCNICERIWCEDKGIVYGEGPTIEAAYENYKAKGGQV